MSARSSAVIPLAPEGKSSITFSSSPTCALFLSIVEIWKASEVEGRNKIRNMMIDSQDSQLGKENFELTVMGNRSGDGQDASMASQLVYVLVPTIVKEIFSTGARGVVDNFAASPYVIRHHSIDVGCDFRNTSGSDAGER